MENYVRHQKTAFMLSYAQNAKAYNYNGQTENLRNNVTVHQEQIELKKYRYLHVSEI